MAQPVFIALWSDPNTQTALVLVGLIALLLGFAAGYAARSYVSYRRHRRAASW